MSSAVEQPAAVKSAEFVSIEFATLMYDDESLLHNIDRFGVYEMTPSGPLHHDPHTEACLQAMCYLHHRIMVNDAFNPHQENWDAERIKAEGGETYGWPMDDGFTSRMQKIDSERKAKMFHSIYTLLHTKGEDGYPLVAHAAVAIAIQSRGVWLSDQGRFYWHSADSRVAEDVFVALALDLGIEKGFFSHEYEKHINDFNDLYVTGWTQEKLPRFATSYEDNNWLELFSELELIYMCNREDLITIGYLLISRKATIAQIKKAITVFGVWGMNPYAEISHYSGGDKYHAEVDEKLRRIGAMIGNGQTPTLSDKLHKSFSRFGWPPGKVPDFQNESNWPTTNVKSDVTPPLPLTLEVDAIPHERHLQRDSIDVESWSNKEVSDREERTYMSIITGLLALVEGNLTGVAHTHYGSRENLYRLISNGLPMPQFQGTSRSTLMKKMTAADKKMQLIKFQQQKGNGSASSPVVVTRISGPQINPDDD